MLVNTMDKNMQTNFSMLFHEEKGELLEALRRDMREQLDRSQVGSEMSSWHFINARRVQRILEVLNPKKR